jgi:hypothetical protein
VKENERDEMSVFQAVLSGLFTGQEVCDFLRRLQAVNTFSPDRGPAGEVRQIITNAHSNLSPRH